MVLLIGFFILAGMQHALRADAHREAETLAQALLYRNQATHIYFTEQLKPAIYEMAGDGLPEKDVGQPWMSSTYALIHIDQSFDELIANSQLGGYEWKQAAVNARDPGNEADAFERQWIEKMNADPSLDGFSGEVEIEGQPYIAVLMRGEVMAPECLPCHGDAADAPLALVEEDGDRGFNRQVGEMVSLSSLRIPLEEVNQAARNAVLKLAPWVLSGMVLLYVALYVLVSRVLLSPLTTIGRKAQSIAENPSEVGEQLPLPLGSGLTRLTRAFNRMSTSLAVERDQLQERVDERTAEVRRQKQYFETLVESSPLAMAVVDREDCLLSCNPAFEELFGYTEEDVRGQHLVDLVVPEESREHTHHQMVNTHSGKSWSETSVRCRADGSRVDVELHAVPLESEGEKARFLIIYQDITGRLAAERATTKSEKLANIGTLAAGIAHELNSPLQVVTGLADSLVRRIQAGTTSLEESVADLETVKRNAWRMADVVRSLTTYLQPSTEGLESCCLNQVVHDALQIAHRELQSAPWIEVRLELADALRSMICQRSYLVQAVVNLILNARDAMIDGGVLTITTRQNAEAERVALKVCDTGAGIPAEHLAHIFDPFFTTKPAGSGTGMGLPVVDAIVRAHNGEIKVSSVKGKGACLELIFPTGNGNDVSSDHHKLRHGRYGDSDDD